MDQATKVTRSEVSKMFWWLLLGVWGLRTIWLIIEVITAPEMENYS